MSLIMLLYQATLAVLEQSVIVSRLFSVILEP